MEAGRDFNQNVANLPLNLALLDALVVNIEKCTY